jgi:hypothetical protein
MSTDASVNLGYLGQAIDDVIIKSTFLPASVSSRSSKHVGLTIQSA